MRLYRTHHHNIEILEKVTIKQLGTEITLDEAVSFIKLIKMYGYAYKDNDIIFDIDYNLDYFGVSAISEMRKQILRDETIDLLLKSPIS